MKKQTFYGTFFITRFAPSFDNIFSTKEEAQEYVDRNSVLSRANGYEKFIILPIEGTYDLSQYSEQLVEKGELIMCGNCKEWAVAESEETESPFWKYAVPIFLILAVMYFIIRAI